MSGRFRHGLHAVPDGVAPATEDMNPVLRDPSGHPFLTLHQQSVALVIAGRLDADTAGRLRMFLSMFSAAGGPRELLLDLSDVVAVDEDGMAPIFEAEELLHLRMASLRVTSMSAAVTRYVDAVGLDRTLATGPAPGVLSLDTAGGSTVSAVDEGLPPRDQD